MRGVPRAGRIWATVPANGLRFEGFVADSEDAVSKAYTIRDFAGLMRRRRRFLLLTVGGLLLLCGIYCLIAPRQYEAPAKVALRMQPASALTADASEAMAPASILSTPLQLETLVNVLRSERLSWRVLTELRLYESAAFVKNFAGRFPGFDAAKPSVEAQSYLLERFEKRLKVRSLPRTLVIEISFRSKDAGLSARVANTLIRDYMAQESESRVEATRDASGWYEIQLKGLTAEAEALEKGLAEFERQHRLLTSEQTSAGQTTETLTDPNQQQLDETGRLLVAASGERILREALYGQARMGNPEDVLAANPALASEMGPAGATLGGQLRTRLSEVSLEEAQLSAEHGMKFPRVVELERERADIEAQIKREDGKLVEGFRRLWLAAQDREQMLRKQMDARLAEGLRQNDATIEYTVLRAEALSKRELCNRLRQRIEDASVSAGVHGSGITVVDWAREPFKPVAPDPALYFAITLFVGVWAALGGALLMDALNAGKAEVSK